MRITSFSIFNQLTDSLNKNLRKMADTTNMLSTGKKLNNLSDDIPDLMRSMDFKVSINNIDQYKRNIDEVQAQLSFADTTLDSATNILIRAKELAMQGANDSLGAQGRAAIAPEAAELKDQMLSIANSKFKNRYIFSGYKSDTASFASSSSYSYQGDSGEINVSIDENATIAMNLAGDQVFQVSGETFMKSLSDLQYALENNILSQSGSTPGIQEALTAMENAIDQVANVRADLGARLNHIDNLSTNLDERQYTLRDFLSEAEDTDIAGASSELAKTQVALEALRQSGAKALSQSLLDFIR